jgi:hypothetical protein
MSLVEELETKVPKLNKAELTRFRDWFERYIEDHLDLSDEVKTRLSDAWKEIEAGNYRVRQTPTSTAVPVHSSKTKLDSFFFRLDDIWKDSETSRSTAELIEDLRESRE